MGASRPDLNVDLSSKVSADPHPDPSTTDIHSSTHAITKSLTDPKRFSPWRHSLRKHIQLKADRDNMEEHMHGSSEHDYDPLRCNAIFKLADNPQFFVRVMLYQVTHSHHISPDHRAQDLEPHLICLSSPLR